MDKKTKKECPDCKGAGYIYIGMGEYGEICAWCRGLGFIKEEPTNLPYKRNK